MGLKVVMSTRDRRYDVRLGATGTRIDELHRNEYNEEGSHKVLRRLSGVEVRCRREGVFSLGRVCCVTDWEEFWETKERFRA